MISAVAVKQRARELGFDAVGVASALPPLERDHARYERFLERGFHGEMDWLARDPTVRRRADDDGILAGARSVICVANAYKRDARDEARDPPLAKTIARYARGRDYHNGLKKKLRKLAEHVRTLEDGAQARPLCDDAPILERAWAARAGLGFVGKNGLLIVPGRGSFVLLGEIVTTVDIEPDAPIPERCGACTRCLDACPTRAIVEPFVIDARKCISYLTIEKRTAMPVELREDVGEHLFGCDDCQTICPFNQSPKPVTTPARYEPLEKWTDASLEDLLALEQGTAQWDALGEGTPLRRATASGLARNAAIVLGNRGDCASLAALERAAESHSSDVVRDAARWAAERVRVRNA
jgi:epoxyqueuosine reductase